jgi:outer membrane lipoprotein-sorting protein
VVLRQLDTTRRIYSNIVPMRIKQAFATVLMGVAPALTGCLSHTRIVPRTHAPAVVLDATVDQLTNQVNARFDAIQSMNASVEIVATTGGSRIGQEKDSLSFGGYIFVRKPEDLRVILRVPILGSQALDMVSIGKTWKLWIPPRNRAMEGTSEVTNPSKNGLENLRPAVFFDSLLVRGLGTDQLVSLTSDLRVIDNSTKKKKDLVEEQDYDLQILSEPKGQIARTLRVIHISRENLLPYQQDIYDPAGNIVTRAFYSNYQTYGDIPFPTKVVIRRPLDQYSLTVTITKLAFNQKMEDDQFDLKIPATVPIQEMK